MTKLVICTFIGLLALGGCGEKNKATKDAPSSSAPNGEGGSPPPPSAAPVASAKSSKAEWAGTYTLAAGTLSIPTENKDYSGVKQAKDDPSKLMGDGKIDLVVDGSKVTGTVEGGAGPAVIDGSLIGEEIRGTVRRKDPKDDGLTGTITAKIAGDSAEGKLNLSEGNAAIVREAKVALKKK